LKVDELRSLLDLLEERDIAEFELEEQHLKLRVRRAAAGGPSVAIAGGTTPAVSAGITGVPGAAVHSAGAAPAAGTAPAPEATDNGLASVKSPIVGTFYRSPDPASPPFVKEGDRIRIGQVLCIIEAMKLMNEIEAEVAGEVVKIHKESGQPVQYGEALFSVRADR
jgi:acetyl-CoA carboxylase biotin carboxyl carrier protein